VRQPETLDLITFYRGRRRLGRGQRRGGRRSTPRDDHTDIARGFIRCKSCAGRSRRGRHAEAAQAGKQPRGKTYGVEDSDVLNVRFNI
jgi:hypothetical protein